MTVLSEVARFAADVRAFENSTGITVVDAFPANGAGFTCVQLKADEMLRILAVARPRFVYLHEQWFDFKQELSDISVDLNTHDGDRVDISPLSALNSYGKRHDGELCLAYVAFVADSLLHLCFVEAEWFTSFQVEASELVDRLKIVSRENQKNADFKVALDIKAKAATLADHAAFNLNRAGREKRIYLAEQLFPECDYSTISRIVDEATNIDWLKKQGA